MPYEVGAQVRLVRDVQVGGSGTAGRTGSPGPLFLAEGLRGVVTGSAPREAGGRAQDALAEFDRRVGGQRFDAHAAGLLGNLRDQILRQGAVDSGGAGAGTGYQVRFENGFVLHGLAEDFLARA
ncbi:MULTISPECIES: hypothetical protein [Streptomyces]|uniref:Uncharacterized protein n=2 Tax=Streptomyces TaxID=1883 RepID=A0ABU4KHX2_9ACTN|nr:hypothetical protein [Streptomyces roseolus]MDX2297395.1 hypothetical protein [Streptomyces roseolus]